MFDILNIKNDKHKVLFNGFTLAEVLITLGIIGIIAALSIPSLMNNIRATKLKSQFYKSYSVLAQALKLMEADDIVLANDMPTGTRHKIFVKYLKNASICSNNVSGNAHKGSNGCHEFNGSAAEDKSGYKYLDTEGKFADGMYNDGQLILADGSLIFFDDCPAHEGWVGCLVTVDINGISLPNRLGHDFFIFEVVDGTLYPAGDSHTTWANISDCDLSKTGQLGRTCAKTVLSDSAYFKKIVKRVNP